MDLLPFLPFILHDYIRMMADIGYNKVVGLSKRRCVMQQVFGRWAKVCEKMDRWIPRKFTVLGLRSILLLPRSTLSASILLAATHIFPLMVTMTQKMKEESENPEKHHDEMMTLRKMYCRIFRILISFTRMRILPVILTRPNMNMLNELTGSRKDFSKFLIG